MLTANLPVIKFINHTSHLDAFADPGEEIDVRHLCSDGVLALFGFLPPPLEPVAVKLIGRRKPNGQKAQLPDMEARSHEERQGALASD